jgi:hypothetical protein
LQKKAAHDRAVVDLLTAEDTLRVTLVTGAAQPFPAGKAFYHAQKGLAISIHFPVSASRRINVNP